MRIKETYNELCKAVFYFFIGALLAPILTTHFIRSPGPDQLNFTAQSGPVFVKTFRVTAYCPCNICCGNFADGFTANGHKIQPGDKFVAAPKEYPFGTKMSIPGYGVNTVMVQDRGGSIKGNRLDVFFPTHQQALEWGVRTVKVAIYPKNGSEDEEM